MGAGNGYKIVLRSLRMRVRNVCLFYPLFLLFFLFVCFFFEGGGGGWHGVRTFCLMDRDWEGICVSNLSQQ